ncbi:FAD-dependent oxidoreductase [Nocardioides mangrovicus]|uniref:FAD-dependent oxidoreductase n=1 Tax=Nocardioides mangrovicus TaxID=2478913 RepID=UPI001314C450|nr:FAD-dependent oxidoreductase [Nocardioides mangrovicus]
MIVSTATARTRVPDADVCVVGAGPAGLALAARLSERGRSVLLLESGLDRPDLRTQRLNRGTVVGHPTWRLDRSRLRAVGGSGQVWGGWCRALDAEDLRPRAWLPGSGWPLSAADLDPYLAPARSLLGLPAEPPHLEPGVDDDAFATAAGMDVVGYEFSPLRHSVGSHALGARPADDGVVLLQGATVVAMEALGTRRRIDRLVVATADGAHLVVRPRLLVLATGGIENARLLLVAGLGNEHDLVGRYFMDHVHAHVGLLALDEDRSRSPLFAALRHDRRGGGAAWGPALAGSPATRRADRLLAAAFTLTAAPHTYGQPYLALPVRLRLLVDDVARRNALAGRTELVPADLHPHDRRVVRRLIRHHEELQRARFTRGRGRLGLTDAADVRALYVRGEQAPNPDSRVRLDRRRDAHGVPRASLDWQVTDVDRASVEGWVDHVAHAAADSPGIRLLRDPAWQRSIVGGPHHMGTTRMATDPRDGVVDADARVHTVDNLYVAGSSVFPTGGYTNPTLPLVMLALRLADHLADHYVGQPQG